jgi:T5SS/PEP-CTERM-associated repeat protein
VALVVVAAGLFAVSGAQASIITTGDVEPINPLTWATSTSAYVGNTSNGSLTINGGSTVASGTSYVGYNSGVTGSVIIDGTGSTWNTSGFLYVGDHGIGNLTITNGGSLHGTTVDAGLLTTATGTVVVDGSGSTLVLNNLNVSGNGTGTGHVSISDGAAVTTTLRIGDPAGILTIDAGTGSSLTVGGGSGTISNPGTVRLVAGAGAASGTYTPISYGTLTLSGSHGTVQALGGLWNSAAHTITVSNAATAGGAGGASATISNLGSTQRVLITDTATGKSVGAGFQAGSGSLTFSASAISGVELAALRSLLSSGQSVLSAWTFSTTGYTSGNPLYLSLFAGAGQKLSGLTIWGYSGGVWGQYAAWDLAYNGTYASFTTTNLKDFAVTGTAAVPIPGALLLFGPGLAGLAFVRRRFGK